MMFGILGVTVSDRIFGALVLSAAIALFTVVFVYSTVPKMEECRTMNDMNDANLDRRLDLVAAGQDGTAEYRTLELEYEKRERQYEEDCG